MKNVSKSLRERLKVSKMQESKSWYVVEVKSNNKKRLNKLKKVVSIFYPPLVESRFETNLIGNKYFYCFKIDKRVSKKNIKRILNS